MQALSNPAIPKEYPNPKGEDYSYLKLNWNTRERFEIEATMIRKGGKITVGGVEHGLGLGHHYKAAMAALWPHIDWILWAHMLVDSLATESETSVLGPGSSGKTYISAAFGVCMLWVWPKDTTVLMSTTTRDSLDLRVWGSAMELISTAQKARRARGLEPLPGRPIASKHRFTTSQEEDEYLPEDKRDGIVGIACRVGDQWVGISNYVGLKNTRVVLIADEAHLMSQGFLDSIANLRNNPTFKLVTLGNPKDPLDPLGKASEPELEAGGWDGYAPEKKTKSWRTRSGGVALQFCGLDSPNYKFPKGLNPYKHLITPEAIEKNIRDYGEDDWRVAMMSYGIMPRTGAVKRVIDLMMAEKGNAFAKPVWAQADKLVHVAGLDAAYSGTGGDRCVLSHKVFGPDIHGKILLASAEPNVIVPVNPAIKETPEAQIRIFCQKFCEDRGIPPENFGFDSTGRGSLMSEFARNWSVEVIAIEFGGKASAERNCSMADMRKEADAYFNKVTALWYASRLVMEGGQYRNLDRSAVEEGQLRSWDQKGKSKTGDPLIQVEPKGDMKKRIGRSPDLWDAECVALEVARIRGFNIAGGFKVSIDTRKTPDWLKRLADKHKTSMRRQELTPV